MIKTELEPEENFSNSSSPNPFGPHHLQSLIIGTVLIIASFISFTLGVIADLIRINRSLLEDLLELVKNDVYGKH